MGIGRRDFAEMRLPPHGLNRDLGFTEADRVENIRRVAEVGKLMVDAGLIVLVSFISPFRAERRMARELLPAGDFVEVFVDTPFEECARRDPKGLYARALKGEIKNFTGVDSPYEPPEAPEIHLRTDGEPAYLHVARIMADASRVGLVKPDFVTGPFNASVPNPSYMQPARPRLPASACSWLQALADTAIQP